MAQGYHYTRQQRNQIQQQQIGARKAREAAKKAEEERIRNDPRRKELARLVKLQTEERAKYDKLYRETGEKQYSRASDKARKRYQDKIRTIERAIAKDISISEQRSRERSGDRRRRKILAASAQKNEIIGSLSEKYGYGQAKKIYEEMSPEARGTYYEQATNKDFVPTPNRAAQKDDYNRAQERVTEANKRIDAINQEVSNTYNEINTGWLSATAGEYFEFKRTGVDPRKPRVNREDFFDQAGYDRAMARYNRNSDYDSRSVLSQADRPNRADFYNDSAYALAVSRDAGNKSSLVTSFNNPDFTPPSQSRYVAQAFWAGITADTAKADFMGLNERAGGAANLAYAAGQIAYIPSRYYAFRGAYAVTGAAFNAGASSSALVFGESAAAQIPNLLAGAAAAYIPYQMSVDAFRYVSDTPARSRIKLTTGIDYKDFRSSVVEGVEASGGLQEAGAAFGFDKAFQESFTTSLQRKGYVVSPNVVNAAMDQRRRLTTQEWFSYGLAGGVANVAGARAAVPLQVGVSGINYPFARGFTAIGMAGGFVEMPYSSISQNLLRDQPIDRKRLAWSFPVGATTAGVLGGLISKNTATGFTKNANAWENLGFALDPSEFISDAGTAISTTATGKPYSVITMPFFVGGQSSTGAPTAVSSAQTAPPPIPPPQRRPRAINSMVQPLPNIEPLAETQALVEPFAEPNPLVNVPVNTNPAPTVPVNPAPNPFVPVAPAPTVPVAPNPNVPTETNPLVDVPVSKFPVWSLGAGQRLRGRGRRSGRVGLGIARYTPSFTALELGIGASKINGKRTFSGFEIRPFLAPKRKKKKKGKKRTTRKRRRTAPLFSLNVGGSPI